MSHITITSAKAKFMITCFKHLTQKRSYDSCLHVCIFQCEVWRISHLTLLTDCTKPWR